MFDKTVNNSNKKYIFLLFNILLLFILFLQILIREQNYFKVEVEKLDKFSEFNDCLKNCGHWKTSSFTNLSASGEIGTCSSDASKRGFNQSIITYSFYGELQGGRGYFMGIEENIKILSQFYPDWVMRVYHNIIEPNSIQKLCEVYCLHKDVLDICYAGDLPGFGNLLEYHKPVWRFFGLADHQVGYMMSRDLDSRFTVREAAAVREWLQSGAAFHVMRDHFSHDQAVMAGMWDAKVAEHIDTWRPAFDEVIKYSLNKSEYFEDQNALKQFVFNKLGNIPGFMIQHDSYYCRKEEYLKGEMRPYPTKRLNESRNFVGTAFDGQTVYKECPLPCRGNPDWIFC